MCRMFPIDLSSQSVGMGSAIHSPQGYTGQGYTFPQPSSNIPESLAYQSAYITPPSDPNNPWPYATGAITRSATFPAPGLPSIHSFGRNTSPTPGMVTGETWNPEESTRGDPEMIAYRNWQADSSYHSLDNSPGHTVFGNQPVDPSLRGITPSQASNSDVREPSWPAQPMASNSDLSSHHRHPQESFSPNGPNAQMDGSVYQASYPQHSPQTPYYPGNYMQNTPSAPPPPPSNVPSLPRHIYTRTLVGPLSANACRLLDEHRKPGVFFLFQDLSVRTEGRLSISGFIFHFRHLILLTQELSV
jgi:hypothetical protein